MALRAHESLAIYITLFFTFASVVLWAVVICTDEWIKKRNPFYSIKGNLFQITMGEGYASMALSSVLDSMSSGKLTWLRDLQHKEFMLDEFKEYMCVLPKIPGWTGNLCSIWEFVQIVSWGLLFCVGFSCLVLSAGGGLLYWYAFVKPRASIRMWIKICFSMAPFLQICSVTAYILACQRVEEMFPKVSGASLGSSVMFACACTVLSLFPFFIFAAIGGKVQEEDRNEALSEQKKFARETPGLYGSLGDPPPDAMAPGSWQQPPAEAYVFQQQQFAQQQQWQSGVDGSAYGGSGLTMGSASGGSAPAASGYAGQAVGGAMAVSSYSYEAQMQFHGGQVGGGFTPTSPMQPNDWQSQPAELRKGVTYMPNQPPGADQA